MNHKNNKDGDKSRVDQINQVNQTNEFQINEDKFNELNDDSGSNCILFSSTWNSPKFVVDAAALLNLIAEFT